MKSGSNPTAKEQLRLSLERACLGEYQICAELGLGGMGAVYLAQELALDRLVAIKVMAPSLHLESGMVERFKREARTVGKLSHPHIIPIYTVRESDRVLFFVMKYVSGRSLDWVIKERSPLPFGLVEAILAQIGGALDYAHAKGVIHRDIKPANIMLDEDGWAVLTDFGIAKVESVSGITSTGETVGTPFYMSPEQANQEPVTALSDQYSLGIVAYEMLAGRPPFVETSVRRVMRAHFFDAPEPILKHRPDCPKELADAVMRMLAKDAHDRWPSLGAAVANLRGQGLTVDDPIRVEMKQLAQSGGQSISLPQVPTSPWPATRASTKEREALFRRRRRRWISMGGIVLTGVIASIVLMPSGREPIDSTTDVTLPTAQPLSVNAPATPPRHEENGPFGEALPAPPPPPPPNPPRRELEVATAIIPIPAESAPGSTTATLPLPPLTAWVQLGTRDTLAFVYINGQVQLPPGPPLTFWRITAGGVVLSIRRDGCTAWDTLVTVSPGDTITIGNRYPRCQ